MAYPTGCWRKTTCLPRLRPYPVWSHWLLCLHSMVQSLTLGKLKDIVLPWSPTFWDSSSKAVLHTPTNDGAPVRGHTSRSSSTCSCTPQCLHFVALVATAYPVMQASHYKAWLSVTLIQSDSKMTGVFQAVYSQLLGDQPCICVLVPRFSAVYTSTKGIQLYAG